MKRFIIHTSIFSFLIFIIIFLICEIEISDKFIIHKTEDTGYNKVAWNINLITNHPEKIKNSIIFFGPSLTQGGICDSSLSVAGFKSYNFGVNHFGNDLSLYFFKRIKKMKPRAIIFHKKKTPYSQLHKLTPLLYSPSKLLNDGQTFNIYFIKYLFKRTALIIEYLDFLISNDNDKRAQTSLKQFGIRYEKAESFDIFKPTKRDRAEMVNLHLNNFLYKSEKEKTSLLLKLKVIYRRWLYYYNNFPIHNEKSQENFVETANKICIENNIPFSKIYIPEVGDIKKLVDYKQTFYLKSNSDKNIICLDDFSFLNNSIYWADTHHLNKKGALLFTQKLINNFKLTFVKEQKDNF